MVDVKNTGSYRKGIFWGNWDPKMLHHFGGIKVGDSNVAKVFFGLDIFSADDFCQYSPRLGVWKQTFFQILID